MLPIEKQPRDSSRDQALAGIRHRSLRKRVWLKGIFCAAIGTVSTIGCQALGLKDYQANSPNSLSAYSPEQQRLDTVAKSKSVSLFGAGDPVNPVVYPTQTVYNSPRTRVPIDPKNTENEVVSRKKSKPLDSDSNNENALAGVTESPTITSKNGVQTASYTGTSNKSDTSSGFAATNNSDSASSPSVSGSSSTTQNIPTTNSPELDPNTPKIQQIGQKIPISPGKIPVEVMQDSPKENSSNGSEVPQLSLPSGSSASSQSAKGMENSTPNISGTVGKPVSTMKPAQNPNLAISSEPAQNLSKSTVPTTQEKSNPQEKSQPKKGVKDKDALPNIEPPTPLTALKDREHTTLDDIPSRQEAIITLDYALQAAGFENPTILLAREVINQALAEQLQARAMMLPNLNIGGNLHTHTGNLQQSTGKIINVDRNSFYFGMGSRTIVAESVAFPGVQIFNHLGDAFFMPQIASRQVLVTQQSSFAVRNSVLLDVVNAYFQLIGAETKLESLRISEKELNDVVRLIQERAKFGQDRDGNLRRAIARAKLLHIKFLNAEQDVETASSELAALLNVDPSTRFRTEVKNLRELRIIDENSPLRELISQALQSRPELRSQEAAIQEAQLRVRQERTRPLFPTLSVGLSAGGFSAGSNLFPPSYGSVSSRVDVDVYAFWTLKNFGLGNIALTREARANFGTAQAVLSVLINQVRSEVASAYADLRTAKLQRDITARKVLVAQNGLEELTVNVRDRKVFALEILDSADLLFAARLDYIDALVAYNQAQFKLFVALGSQPQSPPSDNSTKGIGDDVPNSP